MRVLVTGGAGFIGSHLTRWLDHDGHDVTVADSFISYRSPLDQNYQRYLEYRFEEIIPDSVASIRVDTRNRSAIGRAVAEARPDAVVHLAGLPIATTANEHSEEAFNSITRGAVNVLEAARDADAVERVVYASSSMVYGDFEYEPADVEHPTEPVGIYGGAKLAGEALVKAYARRYGFDYTIVRPSAVYGPTDTNRRVVQVFIERALANEPLELHGGGEQRLDFTHVRDTAEWISRATTFRTAANETYNVTYGEARPVKAVAEQLDRRVDGSLDIEATAADHDRPERGTLGIEKSTRDLGYEPNLSLEAGLEHYLHWYRERL